jgi:hypothetical protein
MRQTDLTINNQMMTKRVNSLNDRSSNLLKDNKDNVKVDQVFLMKVAGLNTVKCEL